MDRLVTVQPVPFVKLHCVLIAAAAAVLLIDGRSAHRAALLHRLKKIKVWRLTMIIIHIIMYINFSF